jgi:hypothetical protein
MRFARWVFLASGVYGLLVTLPLYFMERLVGLYDPPEITHPEFYYGFVGVTLAWQVLFLMIGSDPVRFRPAMLLAAILEKASFTVAVVMLYAQQRVAAQMLALGLVDATWGVLFAVSYVVTPKAPVRQTP